MAVKMLAIASKTPQCHQGMFNGGTLGFPLTGVLLFVVGRLASYALGTGWASVEYAPCQPDRPLRIRTFRPRAGIDGRAPVYYTAVRHVLCGVASGLLSDLGSHPSS